MNEDDRIFFEGAERYSVVLVASTVEKMLNECRRAATLETGGILAGQYSKDHRTAVVTHLTGPPSDSKRGRWCLVRGLRGLREWLVALWERRVAYYLGEWHYHPGGAAVPSAQDDRQMIEIARTGSFRCPEPVLVIVGGTQGQFEVSATVYDKSGKRYRLSQCNHE